MGEEEGTLITLTSLTATELDGQVLLEWETASEADNAGFNIWRSEQVNGEYIKVNESLIPAKGSPTSSASYSFTDETAISGSYYYRLEDIDTNGIKTFHTETITLSKANSDNSGSNSSEPETNSGGCFIGTVEYGF